MRELDKDKEGHRRVQLDVIVDVGLVRQSYEISQTLFSKLQRDKLVASYKSVIKAKVVTETIKELQRVVYEEATKAFDAEWNEVLEAFPVPLPAPVVNAASSKTTRTKRCSRELTTEEMEAMRAKLLADLEELQGK